MSDCINGVIYHIKIGKKIYVGSTVDFDKRKGQYKRNFNKIKKHIEEIKETINNNKLYDISTHEKNRILKDFAKKYKIGLNNKLIDNFIKYEDYEITHHHDYSCENNKQLRCEEERSRCEIGSLSEMLNVNCCVDDKSYQEDYERIRLENMTNEEIEMEEAEREKRIIKKNITWEKIHKIMRYPKSFQKNYKRDKVDAGITYREYERLYCIKIGRYCINYYDDHEVMVWGQTYIKCYDKKYRELMKEIDSYYEWEKATKMWKKETILARQK